MHNVTNISVGSTHTCAVIDDGTIDCWGQNFFGQLGNGTITGDWAVPVVGITDAIAVAAGGIHTCAIHSDGSVSCWGSSSQVGGAAGVGGNQNTPVPVSLAAPAVQIAAGAQHSCALLNDATVSCWGSNLHGELGNGTSGSYRAGLVTGAARAAKLSLGDSQSFAAMLDGTVLYWGGASTGASTAPTSLPGLSGVASVAAGFTHDCLLYANGNVACFGNNAQKELGNGFSGATSQDPIAIAEISNATDLTSGRGHTCALDANGIECWGEVFGSTPVKLDGLPEIGAISAGLGSNTCALGRDGTVWCWGSDIYDVSSGGTSTPNTVPQQIMLPSQ
jgi:alpha-tubulin suppressor-like RCC1 family protein